MANNTFLAPNLTNPRVTTKRSVPVFQDNRPKTPVPYPFIETILPGKTGATGKIGQFQGSIWVPEAGAYIYVYINGFLVNPPVLSSDGTFENTKTSIISNEKGEWKTDNTFFTVLPQFEYGQQILFRAKSPLKQISDRTVPYAVGATPAPIDLGVIGDMGELRAPYDGEYSITGRMSYWFNNNPIGKPDRGAPNFDCNNHVYVYIDGVHAGSYTNVLGEIFRNEVKGTDAIYPLTSSLNNRTLWLQVNDKPLTIPLKSIFPVDSSMLFGEVDGVNSGYWFILPDSSATIKVFKNGLRQAEGSDYSYSVDSITKRGQINFTTSSIPQIGDDLLVGFQYNLSEFVVGDIPAILSTTEARLTSKARSLTLEVFRNGLHLKSGFDYVYNGATNVIDFSLSSPISVLDDLILVDYQKVGPSESLVEILKTDQVIKLDPITYIWSVSMKSTGKPNIYKNGLRLKEGTFLSASPTETRVTNDYALKEPNIIVFSPWSAPKDDDIIVVTFYHTPIALTEIVAYLNDTKEFVDNCLTATTVGAEVLPDYVALAGTKNSENTYYSLPESNLPVNYKVFKNGLRQKEKINPQDTGDYTIDYVNNQFIFLYPPAQTDYLSSVLNYITTNYVVGEVPSGTMDGVNRRFALSMLPQSPTVSVYINGIRQNSFGDMDFKIENKTIRLLSYAPVEGDTILVDYEPAYSGNTYTSFIIMPASTGQLKYPFSSAITNVAIHVYVNGVLQTPTQDYSTSTGLLTFANGSIAPQDGDIIILEFVKAELFKLNPKDQLKIVSPNRLDIHRYGTENVMDPTQNLLFGNDVVLYPGRDDDGEFYFWFDRLTGYWKWTWINPETKEITYFKTGQRITARAWNTSTFSYTLPR